MYDVFVIEFLVECQFHVREADKDLLLQFRVTVGISALMIGYNHSANWIQVEQHIHLLVKFFQDAALFFTSPFFITWIFSIVKFLLIHLEKH